MLKKRKRKRRRRKYHSIKWYRKNYYPTISIVREIETPFDLINFQNGFNSLVLGRLFTKGLFVFLAR